jgi:hypothetical protein
MADTFYVPLGDDVYRSTAHTVGPWSPEHQHMGPPSALLARQLERSAPGVDAVLARLTVEILGPVPVLDLSVRAWVQRPGRSVRLTGAELLAADRPVVRAWAWWLGATDTTGVVAGVPSPMPPVSAGTELVRPDGWQTGYLDAMEWVSIHGGFGEDGPATLWARQRVLTVDGEEPSPLQRLMAVADSGSGAASRLDIRQWLFINTELTVHLWRAAVGEWIGLDADSTLGPTGIGVARTTLFDSAGAVGFGMQSLLVRPR